MFFGRFLGVFGVFPTHFHAFFGRFWYVFGVFLRGFLPFLILLIHLILFPTVKMVEITAHSGKNKPKLISSHTTRPLAQRSSILDELSSLNGHPVVPISVPISAPVSAPV